MDAATLAQDMAPHLPGRWSVEAKAAHIAYLKRSDGLTLACTMRPGDKRAAVRPSLPSSPVADMTSMSSWRVGWDEADPTTTLRPDRPAEKLARQVERRVAAPYSGFYPQIVAARQALLVDLDARQRAAVEAAEVLGGVVRGDIRKGGEAKVVGRGLAAEVEITFRPLGEATVTVRSCATALALDVAQIVVRFGAAPAAQDCLEP